jgi:hypothetical protein
MELKGTEAEAPLPELSPEEKRAQADKLVAEGKKAIALKQWEDGVGNYADALDLMHVPTPSLHVDTADEKQAAIGGRLRSANGTFAA